jgi:hypothetical protein
MLKQSELGVDKKMQLVAQLAETNQYILSLSQLQYVNTCQRNRSKYLLYLSYRKDDAKDLAI